MLPRLLCEQLCSLNPNEVTIASSVPTTVHLLHYTCLTTGQANCLSSVETVTRRKGIAYTVAHHPLSTVLYISYSIHTYVFQFIDEWMGRSIIRSCAKLAYSHAQVWLFTDACLSRGVSVVIVLCSVV